MSWHALKINQSKVLPFRTFMSEHYLIKQKKGKCIILSYAPHPIFSPWHRRARKYSLLLKNEQWGYRS